MVALALNKTVSTGNQPSIVIDPGIPAGHYRIQLVVRDTDRGQSAPTFIQLTVLPASPPPPNNPNPPVILPPILIHPIA